MRKLALFAASLLLLAACGKTDKPAESEKPESPGLTLKTEEVKS